MAVDRGARRRSRRTTRSRPPRPAPRSPSTHPRAGPAAAGRRRPCRRARAGQGRPGRRAPLVGVAAAAVKTGSSVTICRICVDGGGRGQLAQPDLVLVGAQQAPLGGVVEQQPVAVAVLVGDRLGLPRRGPAAAVRRPVGPASGERRPACASTDVVEPAQCRAPAAAAGSGRCRSGSIGHGRPSAASSVTLELWATEGPATQLLRRAPIADGASAAGIPWPMHVDGGIGFDPSGVVESARLAEQVGYDGIWSAETSHDPFLPLVLAAEHTERIELGTGHRRGLRPQPDEPGHGGQRPPDPVRRAGSCSASGSQIKPHIEKRFSMPWSHPAPRMRELILAIRAIWASWSDGSRLAFRGEFYRHTLMTPMFDPGPNPYGNPRIFLAAVGERMTEVAGEVADGMLAHGFTTERYLREVTVPALERGLAASGRVRADVQISYPGMVVTGADEAGIRGGRPGGQDPAGLLRVDPGLPPGAGAARLGRPPDRAQHAVQAGRVGGDGRPHRRRDARHLRRGRRARRHRRPGPRQRFGGWSTGSTSTPPTPWSRSGGPRCWPASGTTDGPAGQTTTLTSLGGRTTTRRGSAPASASTTGRRGQGQALGLLLGDVGGDLDAVPHLAVDLDDHGHRSSATSSGSATGHGRRWMWSPWRRSHASAVTCGVIGASSSSRVSTASSTTSAWPPPRT